MNCNSRFKKRQYRPNVSRIKYTIVRDLEQHPFPHAIVSLYPNLWRKKEWIKIWSILLALTRHGMCRIMSKTNLITIFDGCLHPKYSTRNLDSKYSKGSKIRYCCDELDNHGDENDRFRMNKYFSMRDGKNGWEFRPGRIASGSFPSFFDIFDMTTSFHETIGVSSFLSLTPIFKHLFYFFLRHDRPFPVTKRENFHVFGDRPINQWYRTCSTTRKPAFGTLFEWRAWNSVQRGPWSPCLVGRAKKFGRTIFRREKITAPKWFKWTINHLFREHIEIIGCH